MPTLTLNPPLETDERFIDEAGNFAGSTYDYISIGRRSDTRQYTEALLRFELNAADAPGATFAAATKLSLYPGPFDALDGTCNVRWYGLLNVTAMPLSYTAMRALLTGNLTSVYVADVLEAFSANSPTPHVTPSLAPIFNAMAQDLTRLNAQSPATVPWFVAAVRDTITIPTGAFQVIRTYAARNAAAAVLPSLVASYTSSAPPASRPYIDTITVSGRSDNKVPTASTSALSIVGGAFTGADA